MILSIDIGSRYLYAAEASVVSGVIHAAKLTEITLADGVVDDGAVQNFAAAAASARKMLSAANIAAGRAVVTVNSSRILSRRLQLPPAKPAELGKMVKNEMLQAVSDDAEFVYEYSVLRGPQGQKGTLAQRAPLQLWAYAMPTELVEGYGALMRGLHLKPVALDLHTNCLEKLLAGAQINGSDVGGQSTVLLDLEEGATEIHLFSERERAFSRTAPIGLTDLRMMLDGGEVADIPRAPEKIDLASPAVRENRMVGDVLHDYIGKLADEVQKMVQFQLRRNAGNPVACVYLYGSLALMAGLDGAIRSMTGLRTERIETVSKVRSAVPVTKHINALGAFIRL